jgi:DNA invertase Pin-like site-specific DNA recombinase
VSTDLQDTGNSIGRQIANCRRFAEERGHEIASDPVYLDEARSGSTQLGPPP